MYKVIESGERKTVIKYIRCRTLPRQRIFARRVYVPKYFSHISMSNFPQTVEPCRGRLSP